MLAVDIFMSYDIPFDGLLRNTTGLLPSAYIHNHSSASLNHKQTDSEVKCFQLKAVLGAALTRTRVRSSMRPVKQKPNTYRIHVKYSFRGKKRAHFMKK
uniref:Uncharacterized protein n=1 Tax=Anguilla anguilla TaxID=7936 RepID=A0A0E9WUD3_ANGAN